MQDYTLTSLNSSTIVLHFIKAIPCLCTSVVFFLMRYSIASCNDWYSLASPLRNWSTVASHISGTSHQWGLSSPILSPQVSVLDTSSIHPAACKQCRPRKRRLENCVVWHAPFMSLGVLSFAQLAFNMSGGLACFCCNACCKLGVFADP